MATQNTDIAAALWRDLNAWLLETEARLPTPDPQYDQTKYDGWLQRQRTTVLQKLEQEHADYLAGRLAAKRRRTGGAAPSLGTSCRFDLRDLGIVAITLRVMWLAPEKRAGFPMAPARVATRNIAGASSHGGKQFVFGTACLARRGVGYSLVDLGRWTVATCVGSKPWHTWGFPN